MSSDGKLFAIGINHRTAPHGALESTCIHETEIPRLLSGLKETLAECVALSTCNRTEVYGVTRRTKLDLYFYKDMLINFKGANHAAKREHFYGLVGEDAARHLFRVASSIDSKIVGDNQILGQLRRAYAHGKFRNTTGKIVNQLFQRAFKVGKEVRSKTDLHKGTVSIGYAAVELARRTVGSLSGKTTLIIGAGETARLTAQCLIKERAGKIIVANRSRFRAEEMISRLNNPSEAVIKIVELADLRRWLADAEIVISAICSQEPILYKRDFAQRVHNIALIDIGMPRNIDPKVSEVKNITLRNLEDVHAAANRNYQHRIAELPFVNQIIQKELSEFMDWYGLLPLLPDGMARGVKPGRIIQNEILGLKTLLTRNEAVLRYNRSSLVPATCELGLRPVDVMGLR